MQGDWLLRFQDGRPVAAEELAPDGSLLRRVEPVWTLKDLCREWGKSRRQVYRDLKDGKAVAVGKFLGEWLLAAAPAPPSGVPEIVADLFPEYGSGVLRPRAHRNLLLSRILSKGGPGRLRWAFARFGEAAIKRFVAERGPRDLDRRSLRFWGLYFGLPQAEVLPAREKGRRWGGGEASSPPPNESPAGHSDFKVPTGETGTPATSASIEDIGLMKIGAIIGGGSRRDFHDLREVCRSIDLEKLLPMGKKKFPASEDFLFQAARALAYFDDAETEPDPAPLKPEPWRAVRRYFETEAPRVFRRLLESGS